MSHQSDSESYNRVFVLGGKESSKDDFKEEFGKFGEVKDVWMVEDRKSGEFKGVTYITFAKASEAALAIEELNGRTMGKSPKSLKVLLANDKREGNVRDPKENEKMMRLFIVVPKKYSESDIKKEFEEHGKVEYVRLLKDHKSGSSKGLAFVKYFRAYHAALALEKCDPSFKPVFASPRNDDRKRDESSRWDEYSNYDRQGPRSYDNGRDRQGRDSGLSSTRSLLGGHPNMLSQQQPQQPMLRAFAPSPLQDLLKNYPTDGGLALEVMAAPGVTRDQIYGLMDMTPGMEYCELDQESGVAYVQYKAAQCAAYAKEKLAYLEFPPGFRIAVRYPQGGTTTPMMPKADAAPSMQSNMQGGIQNMDTGNTVPEDLQTLVQTIKKATDIIQRAGAGALINNASLPVISQNSTGADEERVRFCNMALPTAKQFADRDSPIAERLFIVSQPESFPQEYLQDALCRFGNLIDAFFMPGKNFGYAKYASKESAEHAISVLHGQQVCGQRLKVMKADPPKYGEKEGEHRGDSKRPRLS